jgi:hypothetical protein
MAFMAASSRVDCVHGIRDKPIAPASPWQNGFAERLIGSISQECLDHIVVFGEAHLLRIVRSYARYYNDQNASIINKDAPSARPVERTGSITSFPSWADSITATPGFRFSVHTGPAFARLSRSFERSLLLPRMLPRHASKYGAGSRIFSARQQVDG